MNDIVKVINKRTNSELKAYTRLYDEPNAAEAYFHKLYISDELKGLNVEIFILNEGEVMKKGRPEK